MKISRLLPFALVAMTSSAFAVEHVGSAPASHMEIKDSLGNVVCFAYDTDEGTAPIATGCPEGNHTEQLFDARWAQISQRTVLIVGVTPPTTGSSQPTRVSETCVWDENEIRSTFGTAEGGETELYCTVTCPSGVAIYGEARATIPSFVGSDDEFADRLSFTEGAGTESITIYMDTSLALDVVFDRFMVNGVIEEFGDRIYVIEASAVCL